MKKNLIARCSHTVGDSKRICIRRDGHAGPHTVDVRKADGVIVSLKWILIAGLALAACGVTPAPLPTCTSLGADPSAPLLCTRDGRCTFHGEACRRGTSVVPPDAGSDGSGQTAGSGDVVTCDVLAPTADPACELACTDFAAFMAGVQPGSCRFVTCDVTEGDAQTIGACVDGAP